MCCILAEMKDGASRFSFGAGCALHHVKGPSCVLHTLTNSELSHVCNPRSVEEIQETWEDSSSNGSALSERLNSEMKMSNNLSN